MKYFLLLTLLFLCSFSNLSAQTEVLEVTDATKVDNLSVERFMSPCRYDDTYIINEKYVVYQSCTSRKQFTPDMATFRVIKDHFSADKNGIYYEGELVKIDTTGFKIIAAKEIKRFKGWLGGIEKYYWRTNKQAFFGTKPIAISDPATFDWITYCYFKDKNHVYYYDQIVKGVKPNNVDIELTKEDLLSHNKYVYYKGNLLYYKGEPVHQVSSLIFKTSKYVLAYKYSSDDETKPLLTELGTEKPTLNTITTYYLTEKNNHFVELYAEKFDIPTLKALNNYYLIDKNNLYYIPSTTPVRDEAFRVSMPTENLSKVKVFENFATDGQTVYQGKEPVDRDAATFAEFPEVYYYQYDKNGVYNWNDKLPFHYTNPPIYGKNLFYVQGSILYENQLYNNYPNFFIENLTNEQIQQLKDEKISYEQFLTILQKTKGVKDIPGSKPDLSMYEQVSYSLYKDKNKVYYFDEWDDDEGAKMKEIKGYDVATLKNIKNYLLADKNYIYFGKYRLVKNKHFEILAIYTGYRMGCSRDTHPTSDFYLLKNSEGYWLAELGGDAKICFLGAKLNNFDL